MAQKFLLKYILHGEIPDFPFFVNKMDPQQETDFHNHEYVELVLIIKGSAQQILNHRILPQQAGDIFIIPRGVAHAYRNCSEDFSLINIVFIPELLPMPRLDLYLLPGCQMLFSAKNDVPSGDLVSLHCPPEEFQLLHRLADQILQENTHRRPGYLFTMFGFFMALTGHLARLFSQPAIAGYNRFPQVAKIIAHLNRHFRENITIQELCSISNMSRSTLRRNFFRATGRMPMEYQMMLKISEAASMLRSSGKSLTIIAGELGFIDNSYFGKQFKKITGFTPGQYRKNFNSITAD